MRIQSSNRFKKDVKLVKKRGWDENLLKEVIIQLVSGKPLPINNRDHSLEGNWKGYRECHIKPDWLLIYKISDDILKLARTGSHSDLFK